MKYGHLETKIKSVSLLFRPSAAFNLHITDEFRLSAILEKPATEFFGTFGTVVRYTP